MGLLLLASIMRDHGVNVSYIDCLDRFDPRSSIKDPGLRNGRGPFLKTEISKPEGLGDVRRKFSRYGIKTSWFKDDLENMTSPDLIMVTSMMTYWAPGVAETIGLIKKVFPKTPVILGGVYATLCSEHAEKHSGADLVVQGAGHEKVMDLVEKFTGYKAELHLDPDDMDTWPLPAYDLQSRINYIPLLTSIGCPFSCVYCASGYLNPVRMERSVESMTDEILYWHQHYGIRDFAFYDDALLINGKRDINELFENIIDSGIKINFHTPNALHVSKISKKTACLMFKSGFKTLRLGLESMDFKNRDIDHKVTKGDYENAVANLIDAGFKQEQIGTYLLVGIPGQSIKSVEYSINTVLKSGAKPVPTYYTPIPHTPMWEEAVEVSRYNIDMDPVYTNNSIMPCLNGGFSWDSISNIKKQISDFLT